MKKELQLNYTLQNIGQAARQFWNEFKDYSIFAFNGEMGAGKTTFIHHLCDYLNVEDAVSSPTFALINEYHYKDKSGIDRIIYHLDWYRLKNTEEAINAGMEDCIIQARQHNACCFVEWPEKAQELITTPYINICIELVNAQERKMIATLV